MEDNKNQDKINQFTKRKVVNKNIKYICRIHVVFPPNNAETFIKVLGTCIESKHTISTTEKVT